MIYLDNAATSFPKPQQTLDRITDCIRNIGGNPGRSGHTLSLEAARVIFEAREQLTAFINGKDSERLIFTSGGTESLNLALLGMIRENDHVITTSMEHNSVMRPLTFLQQERKIDLTIIQCTPEGGIDLGSLKKAMKNNTRAVVINHGSNVTGTILPVADIKNTIGDTILIVDACQTIGSIPVDVARDNIDILCFSCHKSLLSVQGVGAVYIGNGLSPVPLKFGGTGSKSEFTEQPDFLPDRYESGTPNTPGIASLLGGLSFIESEGFKTIVQKKQHVRKMLYDALSSFKNITVYGNHASDTALPVISINIRNKMPSEIGYELNKRGIYVRVGLHCAPTAHSTIDTFPGGTVRVSPGYFTTEEDIRRFLEVIEEVG